MSYDVSNFAEALDRIDRSLDARKACTVQGRKRIWQRMLRLIRQYGNRSLWLACRRVNVI